MCDLQTILFLNIQSQRVIATIRVSVFFIFLCCCYCCVQVLELDTKVTAVWSDVIQNDRVVAENHLLPSYRFEGYLTEHLILILIFFWDYFITPCQVCSFVP